MVHRCACLVHGTANDGFDTVGDAANALAGHLRCFLRARALPETRRAQNKLSRRRQSEGWRVCKPSR
uniref:Uncharacterized protein n=1 Tax=mine drainage metagenome TaxID=410659 RepID=E6PU70_9ZZZZ